MTSAIQQTTNVNSFLKKKQKENPIEWVEIEELYNKKLWHQLTQKLLILSKTQELNESDFLNLYNNFVKTFENNINPISLVKIVDVCIQQFQNPKDAIIFLDEIEFKIKSNQEAKNLCKILKGHIYLEKLNEIESTKKIIQEVEIFLDNADGLTIVHEKYFLLASHYYKKQGDHEKYYKSTLSYLGCTDLLKMTVETKHEYAFFLILSALISEEIYNIAELSAHPILDSLKKTKDVWLLDLLYAFKEGNITKFENMRSLWMSIPDLAAKEELLKQKISILCIMEMAFKKPTNDRRLTFEEISDQTKLPWKEVEPLLMKSTSKQLIKVRIDEVAKTVYITWIQPRVLDKTQITCMIENLNKWCKYVNVMRVLLEKKGNEILK